nr:nucleoside kinase [Ruminococcus sp.]
KYRSDYDIDTFMPYEISAYRGALIDQLRDMTDVPEINETLAILEKTDSLDNKLIPSDSLVCEFIGNSQFKY